MTPYQVTQAVNDSLSKADATLGLARAIQATLAAMSGPADLWRSVT